MQIARIVCLCWGPTGISHRWAAGPRTLVELSFHPQRLSTRDPSSIKLWRRSLYWRRPSETMVDGALSWSVCRLVGDARRFDDIRVRLTSMITRPFVEWRPVPTGPRLANFQDVARRQILRRAHIDDPAWLNVSRHLPCRCQSRRRLNYWHPVQIGPAKYGKDARKDAIGSDFSPLGDTQSDPFKRANDSVRQVAAALL